MSKSLFILYLLLCVDTVFAETIIYLHGRIIEDQGTQPVHERFGLYDYQSTIEALESDGATVISEVRDRGTKAYEYAKDIIEQIETLIEDGESPENITVVGFSKGGSIAIFVSELLDRPDANFVFLAACADWISSSPELTVVGNIFSIYEDSDELAGSCEPESIANITIRRFDGAGTWKFLD